MAEISGRGVGAARDLDAEVLLVAADDLVGHHLHLFGDLVEAAAHEAFDGEDGIGRVGDGLAFGDLADKAFAGFGESGDGGCGAGALLVGDDGGLARLHDGDGRVGGAQVDSNDLAHSA